MTELEWQTRRDRINTKLGGLSSPWKVVRYYEGLDTGRLTHHAIEEFPTANGPADYALFVNGRLLGIIEAKKVSVGPENVLEQAKRYSMGAEDSIGAWDGYKVPFLISTNGEKIQFLDVRDWRNLPRELSAFPTPQALEERLGRPAVPLQEAPNIEIERLRPYQRDAIEEVEGAVASGKRNMLVAMATGTGKTFLTVSQIYRLLRSGAFKRILFLVDRRALAAQAVREFNSFTTPLGNKFNQEYEVYSQRFHKEDFDEDEKFDPSVLPNSYLTTPQPSHTFVYVSTIQRMTINLFGWRPEDAGERDIDAFALQVPCEIPEPLSVDVNRAGSEVSNLAPEDERIDVRLPILTHLEFIDSFVKSFEMVFHDNSCVSEALLGHFGLMVQVKLSLEVVAGLSIKYPRQDSNLLPSA